jgi:hypothetical protein
MTFNLSEEIQDEYGDRCCKVQDIKQFIKLLKEVIKKNCYYMDFKVRKQGVQCDMAIETLKEIDKLAGDKLK